MKRFRVRLAAALLIAGVSTGFQPPQPSSAASVDVHETMVESIDPAAVVIWTIGSKAMSQTSGSRATRMDDEAWANLQAAAELLASHADRLATATSIDVGDHNDDLVGFLKGAEIQAKIDADPVEFRRLARDAATHSLNLAAAARLREVEKSQALTKSLYDNCRACHSRFWETRAP
jgi:hypothetical protein